MMAKAYMKKLHNLTNKQMVFISLGGFTSLMALSWFFPGFIPSGFRVKPR
jgi:hypothetical protein